MAACSCSGVSCPTSIARAVSTPESHWCARAQSLSSSWRCNRARVIEAALRYGVRGGLLFPALSLPALAFFEWRQDASTCTRSIPAHVFGPAHFSCSSADRRGPCRAVAGARRVAPQSAFRAVWQRQQVAEPPKNRLSGHSVLRGRTPWALAGRAARIAADALATGQTTDGSRSPMTFGGGPAHARPPSHVSRLLCRGGRGGLEPATFCCKEVAPGSPQSPVPAQNISGPVGPLTLRGPRLGARLGLGPGKHAGI